MPQKINPMQFENAEGNLQLANAYFSFMASKLPISRLQRDLTDSTILRNIGVPFGHTLLAIKNIEEGMERLQVNKTAIDQDLEKNERVVAEGIQSLLRREGFFEAYETLKDLTRHHKKGMQAVHDFIRQLPLEKGVKEQLLALAPRNYTGYPDGA